MLAGGDGAQGALHHRLRDGLEDHQRLSPHRDQHRRHRSRLRGAGRSRHARDGGERSRRAPGRRRPALSRLRSPAAAEPHHAASRASARCAFGPRRRGHGASRPPGKGRRPSALARPRRIPALDRDQHHHRDPRRSRDRRESQGLREPRFSRDQDQGRPRSRKGTRTRS